MLVQIMSSPLLVCQVKLPSSCPDGTCDGCLYHILIYSSHACPICTGRDFSIIKSECVNGLQSLHSIAARYNCQSVKDHFSNAKLKFLRPFTNSSYCIPTDTIRRERVQQCTTITVRLQLLVSGIIFTLIALCLVIVIAYRKNKRLPLILVQKSKQLSSTFIHSACNRKFSKFQI